jgi:hypothetical protein
VSERSIALHIASAIIDAASEPRRLQAIAGSCWWQRMLLMKLKEPKMAKLTDTQLIVLSKAAARDDGLATIPEGLNKAAASKVGASLVTRKLMREVQSKPDMPVWREDEEGRGTSCACRN